MATSKNHDIATMAETMTRTFCGITTLGRFMASEGISCEAAQAPTEGTVTTWPSSNLIFRNMLRMILILGRQKRPDRGNLIMKTVSIPGR
jgi:hypothetical protein